MIESILEEQSRAWENKPILRFFYKNWFDMIIAGLVPGKTIEVGSGIGQFKKCYPNAMSFDIEKTRWADFVADAQFLPIHDECIDNLVLLDVLHHIPNPGLFFREAVRTLKQGGRIVIVEPYISFISYFVYKFLHPEPVDLYCNPLDQEVCSNIPFDSNQAVASILFFKAKDSFKINFPKLRFIKIQPFEFLTYPLTGGFSNKQYLSDRILKFFHKLEKKLRLANSFSAFRVLIILEKHVK